MPRPWRDRRRDLKKSLRFAAQRQISRAEVQAALDCLAPHRTDLPLIRLGGHGDGGYLLPDDLDGIAACFSPGVSDTMDFDIDIMERGIPSFMADASVEGLVRQHELAHFDRLFLGAETGGAFISLDDWVARHAPDEGDLLMQMDIEGAEYPTLAAVSDDTLRRFRIIVLELHDLDGLLRPERFVRYAPVLHRLREAYLVVHAHPNNCTPLVRAAGFAIPPVLEVTLLRRDRVRDARPETRFPHPLDATNVPDLPDFALPRYWS